MKEYKYYIFLVCGLILGLVSLLLFPLSISINNGGRLSIDSTSVRAATSYVRVTEGAVVSDTLTLNIESSGSDRVFVVGLAYKSNSVLAPTSIIWDPGGDNQSFTVELSAADGGDAQCFLYYLIAPTVKTANVVITMPSSVRMVGYVALFNGIHQGTPFTAETNEAQGSNDAPTVDVNSAADEIVVDILAQVSAGPDTAAGAHTEICDGAATGGGTDTRGAGQYAVGQAVRTMNYSMSSSDDWNIIAGALQEAVVVVLPTVTTQAASSVEDTTATGNGNITNSGGENCDFRGVVWDDATHGDPGDTAPAASDYVTAGGDFTSEADGFGIGAFTASMTGLPTGTTIYYRAWAHNSAGYAYGSEVTFLTKPAAPTNVAATDGSDETKVVVTWNKSTGATDYHVWRGAVDLGAAGDVATFDDNGATAGTITNAGTVTASDGASPLHVTLSLAGETTGTTSHTYKVVASNATGDSDDSLTDNGYRGVGAITYQWQRSATDADAGYGNIAGATTDPYNDTVAPAPTVTPGVATASDGTSSDHVTLSIAGESGNIGDGRWYQCIVSATGASNSPQTSDSNRGYRGIVALTYEWFRSSADADADYATIAGEGGTTDPYDDTNGVVDPDGRWYYAQVSMTGAATQDTTHDRGYKSVDGKEEGDAGGVRWLPIPLPIPMRRKKQKTPDE